MSERERERNGQLASPGEGKRLENRERKRERERRDRSAPTGWQGRRQPTEGFNCVCRRVAYLIEDKGESRTMPSQASPSPAYYTRPTTHLPSPSYMEAPMFFFCCVCVFVFRLERSGHHLIRKTTQPYHHKRTCNEIKVERKKE
jgi:hypothetical protein